MPTTNKHTFANFVKKNIRIKLLLQSLLASLIISGIIFISVTKEHHESPILANIIMVNFTYDWTFVIGFIIWYLVTMLIILPIAHWFLKANWLYEIWTALVWLIAIPNVLATIIIFMTVTNILTLWMTITWIIFSIMWLLKPE